MPLLSILYGYRKTFIILHAHGWSAQKHSHFSLMHFRYKTKISYIIYFETLNDDARREQQQYIL